MNKDWTRLVITEEGGIAGLLRSAELLSHSLADAQKEHVSQCLAAVRDLSAANLKGPSRGHADQQTIHLECEQGELRWQARFDRADLPDAVSALLDTVRLKPVAPR